MAELEVRVLGYHGRPKEGVSVDIEFLDDFVGVTGPWGFEKEITDSDGYARFSHGDDYDRARFKLYIDHGPRGEHVFGNDTYIEETLDDGEDDEEQSE